MIRRSIIKKNLNTSEIHHVIGHHGSVFFKLIIKYLLILCAMFLVFLLLDTYVVWEYMAWSFAGLGLILFVKFVVDFFNVYLDALVMTNTGITLYLWEGLLEYKTEIFDRSRIETISHNQAGLWDKIFIRGDILIRLEHGIDFPFENVASPKKQAAKILQLKDRFLLNETNVDKVLNDHKKFDVLVEALGEVVKDYIDKGEKGQSDVYDYSGDDDYDGDDY